MRSVELLLTQLDEAYNRRSWHGPNLRASIRGLDAAAAAHRPARNRHNIQEVVVHCAYWKYAVRRRLTGEARASFRLKGYNWWPRTAADEAMWRADVRLLDDMHRALRAAVATLGPRDLARTRPGSSVSTRWLVTGIIAHDLYHAGQIQLLKKLITPVD